MNVPGACLLIFNCRCIKIGATFPLGVFGVNLCWRVNVALLPSPLPLPPPLPFPHLLPSDRCAWSARSQITVCIASDSVIQANMIKVSIRHQMTLFVLPSSRAAVCRNADSVYFCITPEIKRLPFSHFPWLSDFVDRDGWNVISRVLCIIVRLAVVG